MNDLPERELTSRISTHPVFGQLKKKTRRVTTVLFALFVLIYGTYVGTAVYANHWVAEHHIGSLSVAWVIAFIASITPVTIALAYLSYSDKVLEPLAEDLKRATRRGAR